MSDMANHHANVLASIRALDPWFHSIDLGPDLPTKLQQCADEPLDHPKPTWDIIKQHLPSNLSQRRVLDVGCNAGFYSLALKRLGASSVLGVDAQRREVAQARLAASVLDLQVAFQHQSVYDLSIRDLGQFDLVLALGLLYHCRHPLLALERLAEVTRDTLLLESAVISEAASPSSRVLTLGGLDRNVDVAYYIQNESNAKEAAFNWFLPSVACLQGLLRSVGFQRIIHTPISSDRSLFVCTREPEPADGTYSCRFSVLDNAGALEVTPQATVTIDLRVWNVGTAVWEASAGHETEPGSVLLGVHLLDSASNVIAWDFRRSRTSLKSRVAFGEHIDLSIALEAPAASGCYTLEFDLVREFFCWFEDMGGSTLTIPVTVA